MQNWRRHSIFWPLLLIIVGVFLFLNNLNIVPGTTWHVIILLWPVILIVAGLDGFWRGQGYAGATVVTGLGVLFLMGNLGYLTFSALDLILKLWPLIIIAIGLDILIGKRRPWSAAIGVLIGLVVTAGIFWLVLSSSLTATYQTDSVNLNQMQGQYARGTIEMPVGKLDLANGAEGDTLVSGNLRINSGETVTKDVTTSGNTTVFNLSSQGYGSFVPFSTTGGQEVWTVRLNPGMAYDLTVKQAVGEGLVNLQGLKLSSLYCETAVGKTTLTLPEQGAFNGRVQMAIGEIEILVPRGVSLQIRFERALTATDIPPDFTENNRTITSPSYNPANSINLTANVAIGAINVRYLP